MDFFVETDRQFFAENEYEIWLQRFKTGSPVTAAHIHDSMEFVYVAGGSFRVTLDEKEFTASAGDLVLFRCNTVHKIVPDSSGDNSCYVLKVKPALLFEFASASNGMTYALEFAQNRENTPFFWSAKELENSEIKQCLERIMSEHYADSRYKDLAERVHIGGLLLAVLRSEAVRQDNGDEEEDLRSRIYRAVVYMNSRYFEDISAADCSSYVNMSYSYFSRCFRRITGRSFKEYLNLIRVDHAEKALVTSDKSVAQIAVECGYNNVSYFIQTYKAIKGVSPLGTRNSTRR